MDMTGVLRRIIKHTLNVNPSIEPEFQKRRIFRAEKSEAIAKEVAEWVKSAIIQIFFGRVQVLPSGPNGKGIQRKDSLLHRPGDILLHKKPFGLKSVGATYHRLVDTAFQSQIRRNLEAYVDDMVIKSKDEKMLLADIAETFDNLRKINMKLNPNKVLLESALNRLLAKSAERSLPFFNTLKNITKDNKHEYKWTIEAGEAFQQMKKCILNLPSLTPPFPKETLYAYLTVSKEAVSVVLMTNWKGKQCHINYVSRTLNETERNYAPLEKLALSLVHMTRRLRRYFEAHPVNVITDQPIKQILNKAEASGKLAKYAVELGTYNITFEPRNAIKGQIFADFISETPDRETAYSYFQMPEMAPEEYDTQGDDCYSSIEHPT
ncbi:reverse transcriptase domain-containing protein [Tanacetum coccineum]|uniref:Reverse transcriptase domain-containing protein n=1 Tax=Tanacetum coccineum TaxID=301880 RepID=A0ABQ4YWT2_9ASTR